VKSFEDARGFGFIRRNHGQSDVFLHATSCPVGYVPRAGDRVSFATKVDSRGSGRLRAMSVRWLRAAE
jgi:cold shock CspA family protein